VLYWTEFFQDIVSFREATSSTNKTVTAAKPKSATQECLSGVDHALKRSEFIIVH